MKMNDDYLWDGEGEPDPEVEKLEELLGRFRHEGKAPEMPITSRRIFWPRLAVAAAVIVMLLGGLWLVLNRQSNDAQQDQQATTSPTEKNGNQNKNAEQATANTPGVNQNNQPKQKDEVHSTSEEKQSNTVARAPKEKRGRELTATSRRRQAQDYSIAALVDFETANYLESAQMLLRSFRNIGSSENEQALDVSYEKERSRELLYRNIVLRRDAEAKGNLPINDLLGTLEPILLDIANMTDNSPQADVRSIQERIEKKEIVATLQVYSAPVVSMALRQR